MTNATTAIVERYGSDRTRLMDMLWDVQRDHGYLPQDALEDLASALSISANDVLETASFYHFFQTKPFGRHAIYLCDSVMGRNRGHASIRATLETETGTAFGSASALFGLDDTNCIGLSDQEPAMMVDDVVFTKLTPNRVRDIIKALKLGTPAEQIANPGGHARSSRSYVESMVDCNIHQDGPVFFKPGIDYRAVLESCLALTPDEVIVSVTESNIRGRGGAGFPTGLKWRLARDAAGAEKHIICNADEGEPGTFKDRVLLTASPMDVLLGMVISGFGVGS
ncbi:MAG: NAD(P)H-dependent oxidoreductase subunit E, partial [Rhodospirillaceae bacterium]